LPPRGSALANEFVAGKYKTEISEATPVRSQGKALNVGFGEEGFQEFHSAPTKWDAKRHPAKRGDGKPVHVVCDTIK